MKKMTKRMPRIVAAALAVVSTAGLLAGPTRDVAAAEPVPAAPPPAECWGDWCSGVNPMITPCANDAVTTAWLDLEGARLELRWSPSCKTNWAKFIRYPQGWAFLSNNFLALIAEQDTGYQQVTDLFTPPAEFTLTADGTTTFWTPMIYSPELLVRARMVPSCTSMTLVACAMDIALAEQPTTDWA